MSHSISQGRSEDGKNQITTFHSPSLDVPALPQENFPACSKYRSGIQSKLV